MAILEILEQRGLFRLTRLVAFIVVLFLTIVLLIGVKMFISDFLPNKESHVSYTLISNELRHLPPDGTDMHGEGEQPLIQRQPDLIIPAIIRPYFTSEQNRRALENHLSGLDSDEREEYLANLAEVIENANALNANVWDVINRYFEDKSVQMEIAKRDSTARIERQLYVAGAAVSTIFLITMASLVLVLLAIERNTRKYKEDEARYPAWSSSD